jgi:POTRA domain, FtsQ-type
VTQPARRIQWRAVLLRLAAVVGLAGLLGLIAYGSTAAQFFVYSAQISGNQHLRPEDIYQAAGIHEQNIFWIRPEEVAKAIGRLNGVKTVHVSTALPAQVSIEVEERQPVVMWRVSAQQRDWWLDGEGVVLPYHGDVKNTIFVVDSSQRELHEGDRIKPEGMVASVQQLAAALPQAQVFFYQADRGLSFMQEAPDGTGEWPVYVGTSGDLSRKIQILQTLTEYLAAHNIRPRYIDVRWADYPVYAVEGQPDSQGATENG